MLSLEIKEISWYVIFVCKIFAVFTILAFFSPGNRIQVQLTDLQKFAEEFSILECLIYFASSFAFL